MLLLPSRLNPTLALASYAHSWQGCPPQLIMPGHAMVVSTIIIKIMLQFSSTCKVTSTRNMQRQLEIEIEIEI